MEARLVEPRKMTRTSGNVHEQEIRSTLSLGSELHLRAAVHDACLGGKGAGAGRFLPAIDRERVSPFDRGHFRAADRGPGPVCTGPPYRWLACGQQQYP